MDLDQQYIWITTRRLKPGLSNNRVVCAATQR
jgi:hypothetical protein